MTADEFKTEFLEVFDAHHAFRSGDHNDYTISMWLTLSQETLVKSTLTSKSNRRQEGFEQTETRRRKLAHLLRPHRFPLGAALPYNPDVNINPNSKIFNIEPLGIMEIKEEHLETDPNVCLGVTQLEVVPVTHDEYTTQIRNPFRNPNLTKAWRLDLGTDTKTVSGVYDRYVEILSSVPFTSYYLRYIKRIRPIIVGDLSVTYPGYTINGQTAKQTSELDESLHREIITMAVTLALEASSNPRFQTQAGTTAQIMQ